MQQCRHAALKQKQRPRSHPAQTSQSCHQTVITMDDPIPMDVDEPMPDATTVAAAVAKSAIAPEAAATTVAPVTAKEEEDARQAIDLLRGEDVAGRVEAAHRLESVAAALGAERTRDELLPFLTDGMDDEDEVLAVIATSLRNLVQHVGGPAHATSLLPPLELLLTVEEASVRIEASESARKIAASLPDGVYETDYADMISRLATREWFTARMSAAGLIAEGYGRLGSTAQRAEHLANFAALCRDDAPMVRRVASQNLGVVAEAAIEVDGSSAVNGEHSILCDTLLPLYEELAANTQPDSVRLQITENCIALGRAIFALEEQSDSGQVLLTERVLPLVVSTIDDRSWRVRWTAASKFSGVVGALSDLPGAMDSLVPAYEKLLQDPEAEVRTAAALNLADVARCGAMVKMEDGSSGGPGGEAGEAEAVAEEDSERRVRVAQRLVKRVTKLTEDDSENVRASLAMVATELAPLLGKEETISHLVPPVLLLLRDATSEVRLNIISSLSALNEVIGIDLLSQSLLPAIVDLAEDGKWRIRLAIIQHIPLLAKQLGVKFFSDKLATLCVGWLGDDISSIRHAAAANLKELTSVFGSEWAVVHLLPSINEIKQHPSYLRRLIAVQACTLMASVMESNIVRVKILPLLLEMAMDPVPNIRFNVAKGLAKMAPICGQATIDSQIRPVLSQLLEDEDRDVRYFAKIAIEC